MLELAETFNIEEIVDEFLDGVKLPGTATTKVADVDLTDVFKGEDETKA